MQRWRLSRRWMPESVLQRTCSVSRLVDLFDEGLPPVAGGALDQSASFIEASRRFKIEEQRAKAERK